MNRFTPSFLLIILCVMLVSFSPIRVGKTGGTIHVRSNGNVEGTDKIQRDGDVYTFTDNINDSIRVERDNIVVDGAGYTLRGAGSGNGIYMLNRENVTIKNIQINHFGIGIHINDDYTGNSSNIIITGNYIISNNVGVYFWGGVSNSAIIGNNITANNEDGIFLFGTSNIIIGNNITANVRNGINLNWHSNKIFENDIANNRNGIYMGGNQPFSGASNNMIFNNNFINNTVQIDDVHWHDPFTTPSINAWDNDSIGNYWSDYEERYPNASEQDGSGIWDIPYVLDEDNQDNHPLIHAFPTQGFWKIRQSMPRERSRLGVAVVNGKIYAIGGTKTTWRNYNEEYDPATDSWTVKTPMPTARGGFGVAVYQDKIYVIGGNAPGAPTGANEVYDPETDTWETRTPMPTPRENLCVNVVDGKIYAMGGNTYTGMAWPLLSARNQVYDPETDLWNTKASMPNFSGLVEADLSSAVIDDKIYIVNGDSGNLQIYDPENNTWSTRSTAPTAITTPTMIGGAAAGATTGVYAPERLHIFIGNTHYIYDPQQDVWSNAIRMPTTRRYLSVAVLNDTLYAIGGGYPVEGTWKAKKANEQYTPAGYVGPTIQEFPNMTLVSVHCQDSIQVSGSNQTFTVDLVLRNDGEAEAENVKLEFQSGNSNLSLVDSEEKNILPGQESNLSATLIATNIGAEYVANFTLNVIYETMTGHIKTLETPTMNLTVTPQEEPEPTYPVELVAVIVAVVAIGVLAAVFLIRRRKIE